MANTKISALTSATTPLAGTETLPIVQGGAPTKQVSVANLTAGRLVNAKNFAPSVTGYTVSYAYPQFGYYSAGTATGYLQIPASGLLQVWNSGTSAILTFNDANNDAKLEAGNIIQGTAAKGYNFTANTPSAGMTSQLLNWYEEGTWTPAITFGGGSTGITYSSRDGYYTRTGNIVICTAYIALSNKGSSTGAASIAGLPFTIKNNSGAYSPATLRLQNITFSNQFQGYATVGTTTVSLEQVLVTGATSSLTDTNFANNSAVMVCIIYRAA